MSLAPPAMPAAAPPHPGHWPISPMIGPMIGPMIAPMPEPLPRPASLMRPVARAGVSSRSRPAPRIWRPHLMCALMLAGLGGALAPVPGAASGFHDPAAIDREVAQFTGAAIGQPGGARAPVDRQLRLSSCPQPLALDRYQPDTLRVACPIPGSWRIFVPLKVEDQAARAPGLHQPAGRTPQVIARRDLVRVEAGGRGFRISRQGEALEAGRVGEAIKVKLDDGTRAGRIVTVQVIDAGLTRVARQ